MGPHALAGFLDRLHSDRAGLGDPEALSARGDRGATRKAELCGSSE